MLLSTGNEFLKTIFLLIILFFFNIIAIGLDSGIPFALLYGPLLFNMHLRLKIKNPKKTTLIILSLPFFLMTLWYLILQGDQAHFEEKIINYYFVYFALMILSLSVVPILVFIQKRAWMKPVSQMKSEIIYQIAIICIVFSLAICMLILNRWYGLDFNIDPLSIIFMLLFVALFFLIKYLSQEMSWEKMNRAEEAIPITKTGQDTVKELSYSLSEELLKEYAIVLHECLCNRKLYMRPDLSLELLVQETQIPRRHFSELLNAYLGKSFYTLIAEYRIEVAKSMLKEEVHSLTIEALAYECGFNSKTTFNKYFKEITGISPSEYRNQFVA